MGSRERKELIENFICFLILAIVATAIITYRIAVNKCLEEGIIFGEKKISEEANQNIANIGVTLSNFRRVIDTYYLGDIDEKNITEETIKGYINGLGDEYSQYFTKEEWEQFEAGALGSYVGIGIYISEDKAGNAIIASPIKGTPAEEAGLQSGDIFMEVNGEDVTGMGSDLVSSKVKGEAGTTVHIKLLRGSEEVEYDVERKEIKVYHVESEMLEGNIGYIHLYTFDEGCANEFETELTKLKNQGAKKVIIDLRSNTGGLVNEALSIIDLFVDKDQVILAAVDKDGNREEEKSVRNKVFDMEIVCLVNEYSASASEILSGVLRDLAGAKLVGEKTFGKGVIQSVFPLQDGSALKLTTNEYITPSGVRLNKEGLKPDVEVQLDAEKYKADKTDTQRDKAVEVLKGN